MQELTHSWAGTFAAFMQRHSYFMIYAPYESSSGAILGTAVAFPIRRFNLLNCNILEPAKEKKQSPFFKDEVKSTTLVEELNLSTTGVLQLWKRALSKENTLIFLWMQDIASKVRFCIATYHMPCEFKRPQVMTIHSGLALQAVLRRSENIPFVFCGDFNFLPGSPQYNMFLDGTMNADNPDYIESPDGDPNFWKPVIKKPVKSAYLEMNKSEPEFTNHSSLFGNQFTGTLDYLFMSSENCQVVEKPSSCLP